MSRTHRRPSGTTRAAAVLVAGAVSGALALGAGLPSWACVVAPLPALAVALAPVAAAALKRVRGTPRRPG